MWQRSLTRLVLSSWDWLAFMTGRAFCKTSSRLVDMAGNLGRPDAFGLRWPPDMIPRGCGGWWNRLPKRADTGAEIGMPGPSAGSPKVPLQASCEPPRDFVRSGEYQGSNVPATPLFLSGGDFSRNAIGSNSSWCCSCQSHAMDAWLCGLCPPISPSSLAVQSFCSRAAGGTA